VSDWFLVVAMEARVLLYSDDGIHTALSAKMRDHPQGPIISKAE